MSKKPTPAPAPEATSTVSGHAIQINCFIPIPKDDLEKQIKVAQLLLELRDGSDRDQSEVVGELFGLSVNPDVRSQAINKRFPASEAKLMLEADTGADKGEDKEEEAFVPMDDGEDETNAG
jgi:hypothetical protein